MIIVFALLSVCLIAVWAWLIFMLYSHPNDFFYIFDNNPAILSRSKKFRAYTLVISISVIPIIVSYHGLYFFLDWIPEDWGTESDGEWLNTQTHISVLFGFLFGWFIMHAIGRLLRNNVIKSEYELEIHLRNQIDQCFSSQSCQNLKKEFERLEENWTTVMTEILFTSRWERKIRDINLNSTVRTYIIRDCIVYLNQRTELVEKTESS